MAKSKVNSKKDAVASLKTVKGTSGRSYAVVSSKGVDFWNPEKKGDSIEGQYTEMMEFKGGKFSKDVDAKGNKVSRKPVIRKADGVQVALPNTAVIMKNFEGDDAVKAGQWINIIYGGKIIKKGQENKKNPESFHSYEFAKEL